MKKIICVLLALFVFGMLLACDAATSLLSNPTPVVVVVTATSPAGAPQAPATTTLPTSAPPAADATAATPTSAPPPANVPLPKAGTGSVVGRVLWNGKGVGNVDVKLCEDFQLISGCKGKEFTTQTDASGVYTFASVTPGEYALAVQPFKKGTWLYITTGLGIGSRKYTVAADKVLNVGDQHVFKSDLQLGKPLDDSQVNTAQPTLVWDAYPSAAYYEVYLAPENGETVYIRKRVNTNQFTVENPLKTCKYTWDVAAFNDQGIKIADKSKYFDFFVTGQPTSCYIQLISPASKATVAGTGVKLVWEARSEASYYKIHMWKDETGSPKILDFLQVRNTSYTFSDALKPGKYVWAVYAYDQFGKTVAGSGISYIIVP